ncbi:DHH family phosphoesterase [Chengkuizengella axinellae]|uniref:Bifunctional oligoribonuclease/PAP phosphatase NrnA n=1 Tax=Chengkuizengella axinellae TaxID=3064388 RepID=A0ABT9IVW0_9BACL|nr:bifunctional oligoribonuclease/PAP phosphatase NrnA [Chengkuizengella sp. 2205SS18-9]MDP5273485.1 bifunctional oligoribonuclease/PAP phosphatase NrnA [Chengkuizengella sp. 2205SS18-9]
MKQSIQNGIVLTEIQKFILDHDDFLVVSHVQPDGDAISSTCAVGLILKHFNKKYVMVNENEVPSKFLLLHGAGDIKSDPLNQLKHSYKYVISVDCADFSRIGKIHQALSDDVQILNIDHHPTNDGFGVINFIQESAASTTQVLNEVIEFMNVPWDKVLAECIYVGLLTDTGGFRYSNTSPKVMKLASKLLEQGVNANHFAEELLEKFTQSHLELLKISLSTLSFAQNKQIAWMVITLEAMKEANASSDDLEGLINIPRNIYDVEVGLLFKELNSNQVKVSFRSAGKINVARMAQLFNGGGHTLASGALINENLETAITKVINELEKQFV